MTVTDLKLPQPLEVTTRTAVVVQPRRLELSVAGLSQLTVGETGNDELCRDQGLRCNRRWTECVYGRNSGGIPEFRRFTSNGVDTVYGTGEMPDPVDQRTRDR